jgi:hypothetical protein
MKKFELNIDRVQKDFESIVNEAYNKAEKNFILREALFNEIKELQTELNQIVDDEHLIQYNEIRKNIEIDFTSLFKKYVSKYWNKYSVRIESLNTKIKNKNEMLNYITSKYIETYNIFNYDEKKNIINITTSKFVDSCSNGYAEEYYVMDFLSFVVYVLTGNTITLKERQDMSSKRKRMETRTKYMFENEDIKLQYEVYKNGKLEITII